MTKAPRRLRLFSGVLLSLFACALGYAATVALFSIAVMNSDGNKYFSHGTLAQWQIEPDRTNSQPWSYWVHFSTANEFDVLCVKTARVIDHPRHYIRSLSTREQAEPLLFLIGLTGSILLASCLGTAAGIFLRRTRNPPGMFASITSGEKSIASLHKSHSKLTLQRATRLGLLLLPVAGILAGLLRCLRSWYAADFGFSPSTPELVCTWLSAFAFSATVSWVVWHCAQRRFLDTHQLCHQCGYALTPCSKTPSQREEAGGGYAHNVGLESELAANSAPKQPLHQTVLDTTETPPNPHTPTTPTNLQCPECGSTYRLNPQASSQHRLTPTTTRDRSTSLDHTVMRWLGSIGSVTITLLCVWIVDAAAELYRGPKDYLPQFVPGTHIRASVTDAVLLSRAEPDPDRSFAAVLVCDRHIRHTLTPSQSTPSFFSGNATGKGRYALAVWHHRDTPGPIEQASIHTLDIAMTTQSGWSGVIDECRARPRVRLNFDVYGSFDKTNIHIFPTITRFERIPLRAPSPYTPQIEHLRRLAQSATPSTP